MTSEASRKTDVFALKRTLIQIIWRVRMLSEWKTGLLNALLQSGSPILCANESFVFVPLSLSEIKWLETK